MAGRGRSATLPAWMTQQTHTQQFVAVNRNEQLNVAAFEDSQETPNNRSIEKSRREPPKEFREKRDSDKDGRDSRRNRRDRDSRDRREKRSRSNSRNRKSSRRSRSSSYSRDKRLDVDSSVRGGWRKKERASNFDVRPPEGVILPPISGIPMTGESTFTYNGIMNRRDNQSNTKHARKVYVGNIPPNSTEMEIAAFFNDICVRGLPASVLPCDGAPPVMSVFLNLEKCFAFVELPSVEIASAAMKLDGLPYKHISGNYTLRIRRPHDYKPETVPISSTSIVDFNLAEFHIVSTTVSDGPGKVFVGGLPYNITDDQVKELLSAFGPLKAFNLVRDPGSSISKGYGFCEYFDADTTDKAILGLNDMPIGDKKLSVRLADASKPGASGNPLLNQLATKVLRLENMVTNEELQDDEEYEDIINDVRAECSQYGAVENVVIPRVKNGFPEAAEGFIFVSFYELNSSINAALKLYGRKFVDRTVSVSYYDETFFRMNKFA